MESTDDENHRRLVGKLATGFGAMLEQVQELAQRNTDLEQQLARIREENPSIDQANPLIIKDDTNISPLATAGDAVEYQGHHSHSAPVGEDTLPFPVTTGEDTALAIVGGVDAWKAITHGEGPLWQRFNRERASRSLSREGAEIGPEADGFPQGHLPVIQAGPDQMSCPFTSMAHLGESQRPGPLPTPPPTQEQLFGNPTYGGSQNVNISPPPSMSVSVSKCAIRMLDTRSPEEVARYFEIHKHEIPRSHALCVKRYQSNSESIRQLDAKYGSLVNMVQGLGLKHQPLLPAKGDGQDSAGTDVKSAEKVEKWAGGVEDAPTSQATAGQDVSSSLITDPEDRQGRFDRPLKEIRVGESPSRPWGISVPATGPVKGLDEDGAAATPKMAPSNVATPNLRSKATGAYNDGSKVQANENPRMVFTGPVFIGYAADQAAELIKKCGWEPQGSA